MPEPDPHDLSTVRGPGEFPARDSTGLARLGDFELLAAAKLHHTNIVPVHAIGEQDGYHFYAMELVRGQPLDKIIGHARGEDVEILVDDLVIEMPGASPDLPATERSPATRSATSLSETAGTRNIPKLDRQLNGGMSAL